MRTERIRIHYVFEQFTARECVQKGVARGVWEQFQGNQFIIPVFGIFTKIHLRKRLRHISFPSFCFLVCPPTLWRKCAFSYPSCYSSLPWDIQTSRELSDPGASKAPFNQGTTVDFMSFSDLNIFRLGQNMALEMDILVIVGYLVYIHTVQWSDGFLI